ncbi:hypothetical protein HPP92_007966 [Vanilla planifolia]|uniref:Uncharacterized protein n=1 Tax=Vanilla planifolia TaxID=51239 RepID=A0A835RBE5_VANPL|nr:hypothetical protein HPP92_007966 [Vanilla planifolia]
MWSCHFKVGLHDLPQGHRIQFSGKNKAHRDRCLSSSSSSSILMDGYELQEHGRNLRGETGRLAYLQLNPVDRERRTKHSIPQVEARHHFADVLSVKAVPKNLFLDVCIQADA